MADLSTSELVGLLKGFQKKKEEREDPSHYRYVIYARKSTDRKDNQVKSLPDQITECKAYADREKLKVIDIIPEKKSAKESGIRPKFRKMIEDIEAQKYEGILAWHPDRLARNMLEAGEVIDLLDKNVIKSLRFASFSFQNDTSGKTLLGITFVMSKQYSDNLSDTIGKAISGRLLEGKYLSFVKHGYRKDLNQFLLPDGDNFNLLQQAWKMRLAGKTLEEIADYLNKNKYTKATTFGKPNIPFKWTKQRIGERFKDPIYAGVLCYGDEILDLTAILDFKTMVTPDDFLKLNKISDFGTMIRVKRPVRSKDKLAILLSGKVTCGHCNKNTTPQIVDKTLADKTEKSYYSFRCDTKGCEMYGRGTRAYVIVNFTADLVKKLNLGSRKHYDRYVSEMKQNQHNQTRLLLSEEKSLLRSKKVLEDGIKRVKDLLLGDYETEVKDTFKGDLLDKKKELKELDTTIAGVKKAREDVKESIPDYDKFFELCSAIPSELKKARPMAELNELLSELCLNWTIKNKKVTSYKLKPPFDSFENELSDPKILDGGAGRT